VDYEVETDALLHLEELEQKLVREGWLPELRVRPPSAGAELPPCPLAEVDDRGDSPAAGGGGGG